MARGRKKDQNDDLEISDNDNKDKLKSSKNDGSTLKYQKEASHCLETNKYVVPRKIQLEKLPEHVKEMLQIDDESL